MKKKILSVLLVCTLLLGLTGCGNSGEEDDVLKESEKTNENVKFENIKLDNKVQTNQVELYFEEFYNNSGKLSHGGFNNGQGGITDVENETYIYLYGTVKNLTESAFYPLGIKCEFLINDKYKTDCSAWNDKGLINPLSTANIIYYASISDELFSEIEKIELKIAVHEDASYNIVDDFSNYKYRYKLVKKY